MNIFKSYLVKDAGYDGVLEIPIIKPINKIPNRLISFSNAMRTNDFDQWIHFYENDYKIERIWNKPCRYLSRLKKFNGVIIPDFSLYRDMPLVMQKWNTYRGKALGHWLQYKGINVLPNVRFADERSYKFCCAGVPKRSTICVGSYGNLRRTDDRTFFKQGLEFVIKKLKPSCLVVYGSTPYDVFSCCKESGVKILQFDSVFAGYSKEVSD